MSAQLLTILKFFLVALVWLFFLRVVRAMWAELRRGGSQGVAGDSTGAGGEPRGRERPSGLALRILEPKERSGETFPIDGEMTLGRAAGCAVSVPEDSYTSSIHARVFVRDGTVWVEDLGSTNGTWVNGKGVGSPTALHKGDQLLFGRTLAVVDK